MREIFTLRRAAIGVAASWLGLAASLLTGCPSAPPESYCGSDIPTPPVFTVVNPDGGALCDAMAVELEVPDGAIVQAEPIDGAPATCVSGFGTQCPIGACAFELPIVTNDQGNPASYFATVSTIGYAPSVVSVHGGVASCEPQSVQAASTVTVLLAPLPDASVRVGPD